MFRSKMETIEVRMLLLEERMSKLSDDLVKTIKLVNEAVGTLMDSEPVRTNIRIH